METAGLPLDRRAREGGRGRDVRRRAGGPVRAHRSGCRALGTRSGAALFLKC